MRRRSDNGDEMHDAFGSQGRGGSQSYGAGGGYYSAPTDRIKETNHNIMEMQNNAHIDDLSDQVGIDFVQYGKRRQRVFIVVLMVFMYTSGTAAFPPLIRRWGLVNATCGQSAHILHKYWQLDNSIGYAGLYGLLVPG